MTRIKTFDSNTVDYAYVPPTVNIPNDIKKLLTDQDRRLLEMTCIENFVAAKKCLDESIADVASKHEKALGFAGELARRVLTLMDIAVVSGMSDLVIPANMNAGSLQLLGVPKDAIETRAQGFLNELNKGVLKRIIISGSGILENGNLELEKGNLDEAGYVGMNSVAIEHAAKGNLRERMYIPYRSTNRFTEKLLINSDNVENINKKLMDMGCDWQLNTDVINELKLQTAGKLLYQHGAYAASRGGRVAFSDKQRETYQNQNPTIQDMNERRSPLSHRELLVQSGDLDRRSEKKIQWLPGEAWFGIEEQTALHPSVKAAKESGDRMLTGISGTTDHILTMGHMLGLFDGVNKEQKMRDGLLACMGWMIDPKDHSAHEILTSAKSFGLAYTPAPDSYKQIRPGDVQFEQDLRRAQKNRGYQMPDEILSEKHVRKIAHGLFPELNKAKMKEMKIEVCDNKNIQLGLSNDLSEASQIEAAARLQIK